MRNYAANRAGFGLSLLRIMYKELYRKPAPLLVSGKMPKFLKSTKLYRVLPCS